MENLHPLLAAALWTLAAFVVGGVVLLALALKQAATKEGSQ